MGGLSASKGAIFRQKNRPLIPLDSTDRQGYIPLPVGALVSTGTFVLPNGNVWEMAVAG